MSRSYSPRFYKRSPTNRTHGSRRYVRNILSSLPKSYAFGFHKMGDYNGPALKARRNSDDATLDFGFDSNGIFDIAAALAWGGPTGSVFIERFYDLGGSDVFFYQNNSNNQPRFIDSGSVITDLDTDFPVAFFDGTNDYMSLYTNNASPTAFNSLAKNVYGLTTAVITRAITQGSLKYLYMVSTGTDSLSARQTIQFNSNNTFQAVSKSLDGDTGAFSSQVGNNIHSNIIVCNTSFLTPLQTLHMNGLLVSSGGSGMTAGASDNTDSLAITLGGRGAGSNTANQRFHEIVISPTSWTTADRILYQNDRQPFYGTTSYA